MSETEKKLTCGLVMPISAIDGCPESHWQDVKMIVVEALTGTDFAVELVSTADDVGIIQKRIVQNIYDNDIVICDVSAKNPNVMFELGMRLAFDKPAIIIKDDATNYSFDTAPIEHLTYPRSLHYHTIDAFKKNLRSKVIATHKAAKAGAGNTFLKNFGQFIVAKIDEKQVDASEFMLQAVADLRQDVAALTKVVGTARRSVLDDSARRSVWDDLALHATISDAAKNKTKSRLIDLLAGDPASSEKTVAEMLVARTLGDVGVKQAE